MLLVLRTNGRYSMEIVRKLEARVAEPAPDGTPGSLRETQDRELRVRVDAKALGGMKKRAAVTLEAPVGSTFEIVCDEGAYLAGDDTAPPPLSYFSAAIAF
jgi:hypothetical protein